MWILCTLLTFVCWGIADLFYKLGNKGQEDNNHLKTGIIVGLVMGIHATVYLLFNKVEINISDNGVGIKDIERALTPFYTSKPNEERSGMGFTVMESFMDKLEVKSNKIGLTVSMFKKLASAEAEI